MEAKASEDEDEIAKSAHKPAHRAAKEAKKADEEAVAGSDNAEEEQEPATTKPNKGSTEGREVITIMIVDSEVELTDDGGKNALEP